MAHDSQDPDLIINRRAPKLSYFTPAQSPPSGTAKYIFKDAQLPKLFTPLKIRGVEFQNRIFVSDVSKLFERYCNKIFVGWSLAFVLELRSFRHCANTHLQTDTSRTGI